MYTTGIILILIGLSIALFGTIQSAPDLSSGLMFMVIGIVLVLYKLTDKNKKK